MLARLHMFSLLDIEAVPVDVEVGVSQAALPKTILVRLPEVAVKRSGYIPQPRGAVQQRTLGHGSHQRASVESTTHYHTGTWPRPKQTVACLLRHVTPATPRAGHCGLGDRRLVGYLTARPPFVDRSPPRVRREARRPWALECNAFGVLRGSA